MRSFQRLHHSGTEIIVTEHMDGWRVQINLSEEPHNPLTIVGYLVETLDLAQSVADREILTLGHVCNSSCREWVEVLSHRSL